MDVIRDGKTYTLTSDELFDAYLEQERKFDIDSVINNMETYLDEDEIESYKNNDVFIETVADEYRRQLDKYDADHEFAMKEAFEHAKKSKGEEIVYSLDADIVYAKHICKDNSADNNHEQETEYEL